MASRPTPEAWQGADRDDAVGLDDAASRARQALTAKAVGFDHIARFAERIRGTRMLVVQEDRELWPQRFAERPCRLFKQMMLHVVRQAAPFSDNSFAQGTRN